MKVHFNSRILRIYKVDDNTQGGIKKFVISQKVTKKWPLKKF